MYFVSSSAVLTDLTLETHYSVETFQQNNIWKELVAHADGGFRRKVCILIFSAIVVVQ